MKTKFDKVRNDLMKEIADLFGGMEFDVLRTGSQELCIPIVGEDDEEGYLVISFKVPKGSRDGDPYDGYEMAEDFKMKQEAKAEKAKASAEAKAKKIARDEEARRKRAEVKANRT